MNAFYFPIVSSNYTESDGFLSEILLAITREGYMEKGYIEKDGT